MMWQFLKIVALSVLAAIGYGVVHDQVTAHICVEYFTIGHPPLFNTDSPVLLGLGWGIVATWWMGLILGLLVALAARIGSMPKLSASDLLRPIMIVMLCSAATASIAGTAGFILARLEMVWLVEPMASAVPGDKHAAFLTDLWAHNASYLSGFCGGLALFRWTWRRRKISISSAHAP